MGDLDTETERADDEKRIERDINRGMMKCYAAFISLLTFPPLLHSSALTPPHRIFVQSITHFQTILLVRTVS